MVVLLATDMASAEHVQKALTSMRAKNPEGSASIMVDCSHGNSSKNHLNQPKVAAAVAEQVAQGETGIIGIMSVFRLCNKTQAHL
jgi:3-deoxy-7-phosphoheptulonate synthase